MHGARLERAEGRCGQKYGERSASEDRHISTLSRDLVRANCGVGASPAIVT
jgi:hypothetical protein